MNVVRVEKEPGKEAGERVVKLFRNGRNQAVRIPVEFEMPGDEAVMRKEGDRLIIEPKRKKSDLLEWLATLEPIDEDFPDLDESLLPNRDIDL
ncbi:AbrB/MazE/SpoVT family DNA-binding domain-containing protein [Mycoplana sp. MJR14]|uniref:antitoxin n=1 Tax=Mycoplana sp. MJR14 TaxID=3032583 RepID=UPI000DDAD6F2|nr:AbrB/MazE/SpoVT family DNA-binding domain-containing protein [Mycoplana sp. MJR14]MDF1631839.1 AbrB/MazE/SpoVT family DNA-binding domain-containing protein [Mycoplana sp. MJR14]